MSMSFRGWFVLLGLAVVIAVAVGFLTGSVGWAIGSFPLVVVGLFVSIMVIGFMGWIDAGSH
jgi:hypothetical protein